MFFLCIKYWAFWTKALYASWFRIRFSFSMNKKHCVSDLLTMGCCLWTRSVASLTYRQWVVVYKQEALSLWLTDSGLLSMNKKHCVSDLQTMGCCLWTKSILSLTYRQWVVVYEQKALCLWLTDSGLLCL